jgi:integration host factor subunit beta
MAINRSDIINLLAIKFKLYPKKDVRLAVDVIISSIGQALKDGRRVELRGFGVFKDVTILGRVGHNPKDGSILHFPSRRIVRFKVGKNLRCKIANMDETFK